MQTQLKQEDIEKIVCLYSSGEYTPKQISEITGINYNTVVSRVHKVKGIKEKADKIKKEKIKDLIAKGYNTKEIAKELKCGVDKIRKIIKQNKDLSFPRPKRIKRNETLCWECKYAAMGDISPCSWHREKHKPRTDWEATRRDVLQYNKMIESYRVISCPDFEEG